MILYCIRFSPASMVEALSNKTIQKRADTRSREYQPSSNLSDATPIAIKTKQIHPIYFLLQATHLFRTARKRRASAHAAQSSKIADH